MRYKKIIMLTIILTCLLAISAVSAADNATSDVVSVEEATDEIGIVEDQVIEQMYDEDLIGMSDNGTFTALQNKISNADINSTIVLENDYTYDKGFTTNGIRINKDLTIDGNGKTINAEGKSRIFDMWNCNVTIKNLKIINGHITGNYYGGAICNHGETLTLTNVEFINNTAEDYGGAIYNYQGTLAMTDVGFINNSAESGGAISNSNGNLTAINTQFMNNVAEYGGAIYLGRCILIVGCKFVNNTCTAAGATVSTSGNSTIKNTIFANNNGGAVNAFGFNVITNCTFVNNTGKFFEYAIQNSGDVIISKTIFANNTGGAIYNTGNLTVTGSTFNNNKRIGYDSYGGAIYVEYSNNMTIKDTQFNCNVALGDDFYSGIGGAIFASDVSNVNIINVVFNNNIASGASSAGGAIWIAGDNLNIENNTFINNSADYGAAVYLSTVTSKEVVGKEWVEGHNYTDYSVTIYDYIGGVQVGSHHPTYWVEGHYNNIYGDVLVGNDIKINKNIFKSNMAKDRGYAIVDHGTNTRISNNINDTISIYSSTIYVNSTNTTITNNNFAGKVSTINVMDGGVDNSKISATFFNTDGSPLANAQVTFKVGNKVVTATTDVNGVATANVDLDEGTYIVTVINPANNEQKQFMLVIDKANSAIALASNQNNGVTTLTATLTPETATGNVIFSVNGDNISAEIKNGKSTVTINDLGAGSHVVTASYDGDNNLKASNSTITFTVTEETVIENNTGTNATQENPADNNASNTNASDTTGDNTTGTNSTKPAPKVNPVITADNVNVVYSAGTYYTIKVTGTDGKPANTVVKITGKISKTLTSNNGIAKFKIDQVPGTYKITITTLGKSVTKTITVKHLVTLKTIKVKKSAKKLVLQATLGIVNKKYLKNKKVTFKFNGKKYTAKTNKKGVAKVTLKSKDLKKLKVGKKVTYQATYLKDTVKNSVKVKK